MNCQSCKHHDGFQCLKYPLATHEMFGCHEAKRGSTFDELWDSDFITPEQKERIDENVREIISRKGETDVDGSIRAEDASSTL